MLIGSTHNTIQNDSNLLLDKNNNLSKSNIDIKDNTQVSDLNEILKDISINSPEQQERKDYTHKIKDILTDEMLRQKNEKHLSEHTNSYYKINEDAKKENQKSILDKKLDEKEKEVVTGVDANMIANDLDKYKENLKLTQDREQFFNKLKEDFLHITNQHKENIKATPNDYSQSNLDVIQGNMVQSININAINQGNIQSLLK